MSSQPDDARFAARSRDWIDYLPEFDREQAKRDSAYRDAIAGTFVGKLAQVKAAAAPLGSLLDEQFAATERRITQLRDRSLRDWFGITK